LPPDQLLSFIQKAAEQHLDDKNNENIELELKRQNSDDYQKDTSEEKEKDEEKFITSNKNNKELVLKLRDDKKEEKNEEEKSKIKKHKKRRQKLSENALNRIIPLREVIPEQLLKNDNFKINKFKSHYALSKPGKDEVGNTKINQDSYIVLTCINGLKDFNIFGVLDGHGPEGHLVSQFIAKYIQVEFQTHPSLEKIKNIQKLYKRLISRDYVLIKDIFIHADHALKDEDIDSDNSGTTCILVIQIGEHIICANTGDSRAILIFDEKNDDNLNNIRVFPLSYDNKPENSGERERIIKMGGIVEKIINKYGNGVGPYRVWAKDKDYPGLAMSRSIGDFVGKDIGVIPDPEIIECNLSIFAKYIVICSDGVWEFLNNKDVMNFGKKFYLENNPREFCKELIDYSANFWKKEDVVIDDITVVTVFF